MEIWADIKNFEGIYQVSSSGRVRRLPGKNCPQGKYLTRQHDRYGYAEYKLCKGKEKKYYLAHRLVAEAFIPNPFNYPQVNHKDKNRDNSVVDNLEWCTSLQNTVHKNSVNSHKRVCQFSADGRLIEVFENISSASNATDIIASRIEQCACGNRDYAGGYIWKFF